VPASLVAFLLSASDSIRQGMTVVRIWAHSVTPGWEMEPSAGVYNETVLRGLDFVIAEAGKRNLKLILVRLAGCTRRTAALRCAR